MTTLHEFVPRFVRWPGIIYTSLRTPSVLPQSLHSTTFRRGLKGSRRSMSDPIAARSYPFSKGMGGDADYPPEAERRQLASCH